MPIKLGNPHPLQDKRYDAETAAVMKSVAAQSFGRSLGEPGLSRFSPDCHQVMECNGWHLVQCMLVTANLPRNCLCMACPEVSPMSIGVRNQQHASMTDRAAETVASIPSKRKNIHCTTCPPLTRRGERLCGVACIQDNLTLNLEQGHTCFSVFLRNNNKHVFLRLPEEQQQDDPGLL